MQLYKSYTEVYNFKPFLNFISSYSHYQCWALYSHFHTLIVMYSYYILYYYYIPLYRTNHNLIQIGFFHLLSQLLRHLSPSPCARIIFFTHGHFTSYFLEQTSAYDALFAILRVGLPMLPPLMQIMVIPNNKLCYILNEWDSSFSNCRYSSILSENHIFTYTLLLTILQLRQAIIDDVQLLYPLYIKPHLSFYPVCLSSITKCVFHNETPYGYTIHTCQVCNGSLHTTPICEPTFTTQLLPTHLMDNEVSTSDLLAAAYSSSIIDNAGLCIYCISIPWLIIMRVSFRLLLPY